MENQTFSFKKLFIFLIVFIIVAVGVTFALITIKNNSNNSNIITPKDDDVIVPTTRKEVDYTYGLTTLAEKYTTNNIEIEELSYTEGAGIKEETSWGTFYEYPLKVKYFEIHGLKNKNVENKINALIKDTAFSIIPKETAEFKSVSCDISANFNNILSLSISGSAKNKSKDNSYLYDYLPGSSSALLNINLNDGSLINIEDVFVDNLDITNLIAKYAYESSYASNLIRFDPETGKILPLDVEKIESEAYDFMTEIRNSGYDFIISPFSVSIRSTSGTYANIPLEKAYKEFAFFKRFLSQESLFTNEYNNAKEIYLGFDEYSTDNFMEPLDNLFIYFYSSETKENDKYYKDVFLKSILERIEAEKEYSKKQPNTMTVMLIDISNWRDINKNIRYWANISRCELSKKLYDSEFKEGLLRCYRVSSHASNEIAASDADSFFESFNEKNGNIQFSYKQIELRRNDVTGNLLSDNSSIIPNSSTELISNSTLASLGKDELNKAYNEIFARHGHDFTTASLREYFMGLYWYKPVYKKSVSIDELNDIEKQNIEIIKKKINELN